MLELRHIKKSYDNVTILEDMNLKIQDGEIVSILGPSGCGKTTLLNLVLGLTPADQGQILFDGKEIQGMKGHAITSKGLVQCLEGRHVFSKLTVAENLRAGAYRRKDTKGIRDDLEYVYTLFPRLLERQSQLAGTLSGGEQQREAIVRALAARPAIILADEPTGNLDTAGSHDVIGLLQVLARQYQQTVIVITHDPDIAQMAERIVRIEDGRILSSSPADEMVEKKVYGRSSDGEGR